MRKKRRSTETDLLRELQKMADRKRGLTEAAEKTGLTVQFLSDVLKGRRGVSERLARGMGYRQVVEYERVD